MAGRLECPWCYEPYDLHDLYDNGDEADYTCKKCNKKFHATLYVDCQYDSERIEDGEIEVVKIVEVDPNQLPLIVEEQIG